ncbi:GspE/PulE family protein [Patescibacteria group bacterium]|nr:GspE/PulE family protein [Patescibacteria group bacterium]
MTFTIEQLEKLLIGGDFLKKEQFDKARDVATNRGISLPEAIVDLGFLSDAQIGSLLAGEQGIFFVDLSKERIDQNVLTAIPERVAKARMTVAYKRVKDVVWVATLDTENYEFFALLQKKIGAPLKVVLATSAGIEEALKAYQKEYLEQARELIASMRNNPHEEDAVKLVELMLLAAHKGRASDIHIEPEEFSVVVRFRIDGDMHEMFRYPPEFHEKVVFRVKILSRLRTDEHAQAQDGRFEIKTEAGNLNLHVSILPITRGENVVMRLLSERFQRLRLEDLGLQEDDLEKVDRAAALPHGMIIAVGPTGSGKTTTLYAILHILNQPDVNVMTIEDPVEYDIQGIRQIQVNPRTNLTFGVGLKSLVRQDPDVIMVGEIRDPETANISVNAALTGHLVLSTLHANDSATTFPRLFEMGVEPFLIASSLNVIIAQRLVRKICPNCMESVFLNAEIQKAIEGDPALHRLVQKFGGEKDIEKIRLYHGKGCRVCGDTGYRGRTGIYEILEVTEEIRPLIVGKQSADDIRKKAIEQGMRTMIEDGFIKVFKGQTTIDEIIRATKA